MCLHGDVISFQGVSHLGIQCCRIAQNTCLCLVEKHVQTSVARIAGVTRIGRSNLHRIDVPEILTIVTQNRCIELGHVFVYPHGGMLATMKLDNCQKDRNLWAVSALSVACYVCECIYIYIYIYVYI